MDKYELILDRSCDISIIKRKLNNDIQVVWHKCYNLGDSLIENLIYAFFEYEKLNKLYWRI